LTELKDNQVEIILYQDQTRDEFQIIINSVLMMPLGFPLSAVSPRGKYNIAKQVYRVIHDKFAYGSSFVSSGSVKEISAIIDEMLKLFTLKTRKSFTPAYVNTSGRVIDKKVLSPGRISMGFDPSALTPIAGNEVQGATSGEIAFFKELQDLVNKSTVSEQFTGQQGKSGTTATEVIELQKQARLTLTLTIASCAFLEMKLGYLRLFLILDKWFEPIDTRVEDVEEARELLNVYRTTNREVNIEGEGFGERMVIPTDSLPDSVDIRQQELNDEKAKGKPVRKIYLNPTTLKNAKIFWYIKVNPKERESSPFAKMEFREELNDILTMINIGSVPNRDAIEEEFSRVHRKSRSKFFQKPQQGVTQDPSMAGGGAKGSPRAPMKEGQMNPPGIPALPAGALGGLG
jgi:hypothetical protein